MATFTEILQQAMQQQAAAPPSPSGVWGAPQSGYQALAAPGGGLAAPAGNTFSPDYQKVADLSGYPGAYYFAGDPGGGSEGAAPLAAGYYTGGLRGGADSGPMTAIDPYRQAKYTDFDFSQLNDPNSPIRQFLKTRESAPGAQTTLWGGTPYTSQGGFNDPVTLGLALSDLGVPKDQLASLLGPQYASQLPALQQVQDYNDQFNAATRDNESTIAGMPTPFVIAMLAMMGGGAIGAGLGAAAGGGGAGAGAGAGAAGAELGTFGGATGALGTAEAGSLAGGLGGLEAGASPFLSGLDAGAIAGADFTGVPIASLGGGAGAGAALGAGAESLLGPATGSIESAPVIGASGTPTVSGIAAGAGPFVPVAGGIASGIPGIAANASGGSTAALPGATEAAPAATASPAATGMPAAVPETAASLEGQGLTQTGAGQFETMPSTLGGAGAATPLGAGVPAAAAAGASGAASGGGTAGTGAAAAGTPLSRILDGTGTTADYLSTFGSIAPAALGAYAADRQASAMSDLADKYLAIGAPSRARYESSFQPGFSMTNEPGYQGALDQTTEAFLRKASMQGNPAGNPGAWAETLKGVNNSLALPALYNYRNQNASTGGYNAFNTAAPGAATGAINAGAGVYNAIGAGAADVFNPRPAPISLNDIYRAARGGLA